MRKPKLLRKAPVSPCFIDRIEIRALEILYESERQKRPIVDVPDDRRDIRPSEPRRRAKTPFTRDQLEAIRRTADRYRLK